MIAGVLPGAALGVSSRTPAEDLYQSYCASCHGVRRLGGLGPPLLPGDLERLSRADAAAAITDGLPETHMPGFSDHLSKAQIRALVNLIYQAPDSEESQSVTATDRAGHGYP
ncbi:MAG: cytochrome c [Arenicellales bacterium]